MKSKDNANKPVGIYDWIPEKDEIYFQYNEKVQDGMIVQANFGSLIPITRESFNSYVIKQSHFRKRMHMICHHLNYFIVHYDPNHDILMSLISVKYLIERNTDIGEDVFRKMMKKRVFTNQFLDALLKITDDLYELHIDNDDGKYKSTPKITDAQGKILVTFSFGMKFLFPTITHFVNINSNYVEKTAYIKCFKNVFMDMIELIENRIMLINFAKAHGLTDEQRDAIDPKTFSEEERNAYHPNAYNALCELIHGRVERNRQKDDTIWVKKQQIRGDNVESFIQVFISEILIVKGLYKLDYRRNPVSYIDGILFQSYNNFKQENFEYKPVDITDDDSGDTEYMSRAEAMEMASYFIDESMLLINDVNNARVMKDIKEKFNIPVSKEKLSFYLEHCRFTYINQELLRCFFTKYFKDPFALKNLGKEDLMTLTIILKEYLQMHGMYLLSQFLTANIIGKYRESPIRNNKFKEKLETHDMYQNIIKKKFRYMYELNTKEDKIKKILSIMINSCFVCVDINEEINGITVENVSIDQLNNEFCQFLSII